MNPLLQLAAFLARILPASLKRGVYRFKPLARLVRRSLNRAAPTGLSEAQVAAGGLQGMTLALDLQSEKDYWLGMYEPELQQALRDWVAGGAVVYDVGANIGYVGLLFSRAVGEQGRVVCFEALPANVARIQRNLALNGMEERVQVVHAAMVDQSLPVRFLVHPSNAMGKAVGSAGREQVDAYVQEIEVPGLTLDEFVFSQGGLPPQVVKMDIEGGEVLAVRGMERLLAEVRPVLMIELHGQAAAAAVWESLKRHGYVLRRMQSGYPPVEALSDLDWKAYIVGDPAG
jgi:FkbM family methyltransferase